MQNLSADGLKIFFDQKVLEPVLCGPCAMELYFSGKVSFPLLVTTSESMSELAVRMDRLEFTGNSWSSIFLDLEQGPLFLDCDKEIHETGFEMDLLKFQYDVNNLKYLDPDSIIAEGSKDPIKHSLSSSPFILLEAAMLKARLGDFIVYDDFRAPSWYGISGQDQKFLLEFILQSPFPDKGFEFLKQCGFIEEFWGELHLLDTVEHDKEYHPEGDGWNHVMSALTHCKNNSLLLRMSVLLHDIGKANSAVKGSNRFDNHAAIGARMSEQFLRNLGYQPSFIRDVSFLITNHMMPSSLEIMPAYRIESLMKNSLSPVLLELFYADLAASYSPMDSYYDTCRVFKRYHKIQRNPYRKLDPSRQIMEQKNR